MFICMEMHYFLEYYNTFNTKPSFTNAKHPLPLALCVFIHMGFDFQGTSAVLGVKGFTLQVETTIKAQK